MSVILFDCSICLVLFWSRSSESEEFVWAAVFVRPQWHQLRSHSVGTAHCVLNTDLYHGFFFSFFFWHKFAWSRRFTGQRNRKHGVSEWTDLEAQSKKTTSRYRRKWAGRSVLKCAVKSFVNNEALNVIKKAFNMIQIFSFGKTMTWFDSFSFLNIQKIKTQ